MSVVLKKLEALEIYFNSLENFNLDSEQSETYLRKVSSYERLSKKL